MIRKHRVSVGDVLFTAGWTVVAFATFILLSCIVGSLVSSVAGCTPPALSPEQQAIVTEGQYEACMHAGQAIILTSPSCEVAVSRLNALVTIDPSCRALYGDAGPSLVCGFRGRLDGGVE